MDGTEGIRAIIDKGKKIVLAGGATVEKIGDEVIVRFPTDREFIMRRGSDPYEAEIFATRSGSQRCTLDFRGATIQEAE